MLTTPPTVTLTFQLQPYGHTLFIARLTTTLRDRLTSGKPSGRGVTVMRRHCPLRRPLPPHSSGTVPRRGTALCRQGYLLTHTYIIASGDLTKTQKHLPGARVVPRRRSRRSLHLYPGNGPVGLERIARTSSVTFDRTSISSKRLDAAGVGEYGAE